MAQGDQEYISGIQEIRKNVLETFDALVAAKDASDTLIKSLKDAMQLQEHIIKLKDKEIQLLKSMVATK